MKIDSQTFKLTEAGFLGRWALTLGIAGLVLCIIGYFVDPAQMFHSYLTSFAFWTTLSLGALFFVMLHHLTNSTWSIVIRRMVETIMAVLPYMAILFIPILIGMNELYHWTDSEAVAGDHLLQHKSPYLNTGFFIIRTIVYFVIWTALARMLYKTSISQDRGFQQGQIQKLRKISAPGMVLFALSVTYAAFDWLMSQDAHWYSTIFGVYVFAGGLVSALAFIAFMSLFLRRRGILSDSITTEHYHDLGKLIFAFMVFWAYVAFSQYFLIWYANIPEETIWFHYRYRGSWKFVSLLLVFGYFVIPFIILISRGAKRNLTLMKIMAGWLLFMHWVDLYWIIMPNHKSLNAWISWMDVTAMAGIGGIYLWLFWRRFIKHPLVPVNDPRLEASIKFVNN